MSFNDSIADMLTRIRNAVQAGHKQVSIPYSKMKAAIAELLVKNRFISGADAIGTGARRALVLTLKYTADKQPMFSTMMRVSKPGKRVYVSREEIRPVRQGSGVSIISTPRGIMLDDEARKLGVGGEVICTIW